MALRTHLCDALEIKFPIVQAPIGSATTPELAAAVSNAGRLGIASMVLYAGQSVRQVAEVRPAEAVLEALVSEAREAISRVADRRRPPG